MTSALLLAGLLLLSACSGAQKGPSDTRAFPRVQVPSLYSGQDEMMEYVLDHFWDAYLTTDNTYRTDSLYMAGVGVGDIVEQIFSYAAILESCPIENARKSIDLLMDRLEACHDSDTLLFSKMTSMLSDCLYDPNSEMRDEDLYSEIARRLSASPYVSPDMKDTYEYQARMCSLNARGTGAADFAFIDTDGVRGTLYGVKSEFTVLIFVNPGCHACGEVVAPFSSEPVMRLISDGRLSVLGIYIDDEIDKWKEGRDELPAHWINGYDPEGIIRADSIYSVRAIPSIYLLDKDKNVIMKDAVPQRAVAFLQNNMSI
ncbi:MAG: DUF5106 domain-containing protein [Bacteroidales bacterium]|nr:DUF5106 domain-containing protein [Candidatus Cryptobacteroides onthequi]